MIGRVAGRLLAALVGVVLWPVGVWDSLQAARADDPWETDGGQR